MNRHGLFLTLACSAQLWGGILQKDQQYRFCGTECSETICTNQPGPACNKGKSKLKIIETAEKYKLAFVEYRDNGDPWDWAEVALAEQLITESRSRGPIKLVFYVHGWKNNADERIAPNFGDVENSI